MKFIPLITDYESYPFLVARLDNKIVLKESPDIDYSRHKTLTNNIESVLGYVLADLSIANVDLSKVSEQFLFYQLDSDGLFQLEFTNKGTRIDRVNWHQVSKDAEMFTILYDNENEVYHANSQD